MSGEEAEAFVASVAAHADMVVHHAPEEAGGHSDTAEAAHASVLHTHTVPTNLPTVGYDALFALEDEAEDTGEEQHLNVLENHAHAQRVLLSSDAMRFFVKKVGTRAEQTDVLDAVLKKARISFPSEEGWVVLTLPRMEKLVEEVLETSSVSVDKKEISTTALESSVSYEPMVASSLAEAIVSKNVIAAYQLIANRPMVALADAASDIDALCRERRGEQVTVSDLLRAYTREMSTDTLESVALALTSALDGKYHTEEEAVKMAILKAVKVLK